MRQTKRLLSVIAVMSIAACTDNSINGPYGDVSGTYQLTVFAGRTLPATIVYHPGDDPALPNGGTMQWTDGTMTLQSNGTFVESDNYIMTPVGEQSVSGTYVSSGTYTVNGVDFTLTAPPQNGYGQRFATGTVQFGTINYDEDNGNGTTSSYEYKR